MDVYEAVDSRRAVRAFTAEPVPRPVLEGCSELRPELRRAVVGADGPVLLCGVAVGYEDEAAPHSRTDRAGLAETVSFVGM